MNYVCIITLFLTHMLFAADNKTFAQKSIADLTDDIKRLEELRQQCIESCADSRDPVDKQVYAEHGQSYYAQLATLKARLSDALSKQNEKK